MISTPKKSPANMLRRYIKQGSQGAPVKFWVTFSKLVNALPEEALPQTWDNISAFLEALVDGSQGSHEPKSNHQASWRCYFEICSIFLHRKGLSEEIKGQILECAILPIYYNYIDPTTENARWTISSSAAEVCANGLDIISK